MEPHRYKTLSTAVAYCEANALEAWRQYHVPADPLEEAMATWVTHVEVCYERRHGGNVWVTVSIHTKRARYNDVTVFHLQSAGNKAYILDDILSSRTTD